jgi:hypothetical protein
VLRSANPAPPGCPACHQALTSLDICFYRGGKRPELWWECPDCAWIGYQSLEDEPLQPMHRLADNCPFCCDPG